MPRRASVTLLLLAPAFALGCDDCGAGEQPRFTATATGPTTEGVVDPSEAGPPIAERCEEAATRAAEVLGEHAGLEMAAPLRECIGMTDRGAWMFAPIAATSEELEGEDPYGMGEPGALAHGTATTVRYRVTYLAPGGETIEEDRERTVSRDTFNQSSETVRVQHAFDYDGDGHSELLLLFGEFVFEDSGYSQVFWTVRDGQIRPYAPADGIDVVSLVDRDGDGRMDLVSAEKIYGTTAYANTDGSVDGTPEVLFHALPDGSFTAADEVAASFLREKCPAAPASLIVDPEDVARAELDVTCARLWGASARVVRERIDAELLDVPSRDRDVLADVLHTRADIDPPVTLSGGAAPTPTATASASSAWYCLCYRERDDSGSERDATACRRSEAPCAALEHRAAAGAGNMVSLISACRNVGEAEHPRSLLGEAAWEPSSRPGAFWLPGACVMR